jgi:predicted DNA-binding transcriptional regulator YafY
MRSAASLLLNEVPREKGNRTQRVVEPHILFLNWPAWYLLAWDDWREGARFFLIELRASPTSRTGNS